MKCKQAIPYLSAASDELDPVIAAARDEHVLTCEVCASEVAKFEMLRASLALMAAREVEVPAGVLSGIMASTERDRRRTLPFVPVPLEALRAVQENREAIAGAAGIALLAAGTAWALWRGMRSLRSPQAAR